MLERRVDKSTVEIKLEEHWLMHTFCKEHMNCCSAAAQLSTWNHAVHDSNPGGVYSPASRSIALLQRGLV
jgi:hypothetical protein